MKVKMIGYYSTRMIRSKLRRNPLFPIMVISVLLRLSVALAMGDLVMELPGIFDQISYHNLALRIVNGYGFSFGELWWPITPANAPTAHWSFLYSLFLSFIYHVFGPHPIIARIVQAIFVGIAHPYIAYQIGSRIFGKNVGVIAAAVTAIYIYFFYYSGALMTEPFYITAILFSLYLAIQLAESKDQKREIQLSVALGGAIGGALLLRQVFLLFLPFLFLWIWLSRFRQSRCPPVTSTVLSLVLIICMIAPVTIFNYSRFGRLVLLNTNSGYAFFWGNHPIYGTKFIPILSTDDYRAMIPEEIRYLDEAALDQELLKRGIHFVIDDPQRYFLLSLSRIPSYFMFWYSSQSSLLSNISRMASFGLFLPFMLYGLALSIKRHHHLWDLLFSPEGLLILFAVVYSSAHLLTWALIRYRLPVDAILLPFASMALMDVAQRIAKAQHELVTE